MRKLHAHLIGVDEGSTVLFSDFSNGGDMWTGTGPRERRRRVKFSEKFSSTPSVHVTLSLLDLDSGANVRTDISAEKIELEGFDIVFRTWGDTKVARVRASWMAIGGITDTESMWDLY